MAGVKIRFPPYFSLIEKKGISKRLMLMCNSCYELFESDTTNLTDRDKCPLYHCNHNDGGILVSIDSEIAEPISILNKEFIKNNLPIRTVFCCSGHPPFDTTPYLGLEIDPDYCYAPEEEEILFETLNDQILDKCVETLNEKIKDISEYKVIKPFAVYLDERENGDGSKFYRLYVNDLGVEYIGDESNIYSRFFPLYELQLYFKTFLMDFANKIKTLEIVREQ